MGEEPRAERAGAELWLLRRGLIVSGVDALSWSVVHCILGSSSLYFGGLWFVVSWTGSLRRDYRALCPGVRFIVVGCGSLYFGV